MGVNEAFRCPPSRHRGSAAHARGFWLAAATLRAAPAGAHTSAPIVNGVDTVAYPAVGALLTPADPNRAQLLCSGTLIGCHALTAAHCVERDPNPSSYVVFAARRLRGVSDRPPSRLRVPRR
jgi:secreted trypsin-like serine protease